VLPPPEILIGAGLVLPRLSAAVIGSTSCDLPPMDEFVNEDGLQLGQVVKKGRSDEDDVFPGKIGGRLQLAAATLACVSEYRLLKAGRYFQGGQTCQIGHRLTRHAREVQRQRRQKRNQVLHLS